MAGHRELARAAAGVRGVVRRGLAPLQAMRRDAASVTANRLDTRLSLDAVPMDNIASVEVYLGAARIPATLVSGLGESLCGLTPFLRTSVLICATAPGVFLQICGKICVQARWN